MTLGALVAISFPDFKSFRRNEVSLEVLSAMFEPWPCSLFFVTASFFWSLKEEPYYILIINYKWLVCDTNSLAPKPRLKKLTARNEKKHDMRPSTPHCITVPQLGTAPKTNMFHLKINPWKRRFLSKKPMIFRFPSVGFHGASPHLRFVPLLILFCFSCLHKNSPPNNSPYKSWILTDSKCNIGWCFWLFRETQPPNQLLPLITKHPNQQWPASIGFSSTPGCNKNSQRQNNSDKGYIKIIFSSILTIKSHYIL